MKHLSRILIWTLVCLVSVAAKAGSEAGQDFVRAANAIPQELIQLGYKKIGRLDLKKLVASFNQIELHEQDWVETQQPDGHKRIFARWERTKSGPRVILNTSTWDAAHSSYKDSLALHEVLGASGFDDEDYSLSTSLWLLRENGRKKILKRSEVNYILEQIRNTASTGGGGVIGVGGGGDLWGPGLKISTLQVAIEKFENSPNEENRYGVFNAYALTQLFKVEGSWKWKKQ